MATQYGYRETDEETGRVLYEALLSREEAIRQFGEDGVENHYDGMPAGVVDSANGVEGKLADGTHVQMHQEFWLEGN